MKTKKEFSRSVIGNHFRCTKKNIIIKKILIPIGEIIKETELKFMEKNQASRRLIRASVRNDKVFQSESHGLDTKWKWAIGIGVSVVALVILGLLFYWCFITIREKLKSRRFLLSVGWVYIRHRLRFWKK